MNIKFPEVSRINFGYSLNIIRCLNFDCKLSEDEIKQDLDKLKVPNAVHNYIINRYFGRDNGYIDNLMFLAYRYVTSCPGDIKKYNGVVINYDD